MFNGKRIKELEDKVSKLEGKINILEGHLVFKTEIDYGWLIPRIKKQYYIDEVLDNLLKKLKLEAKLTKAKPAIVKLEKIKEKKPKKK